MVAQTGFLGFLRRHGFAAYDFLIFLFVVAVVVFFTVSLAAEDKVVLLKVFAVFYFSLLPPLLYLQFSSQRTLAVWRDYVSNLYKLRADDPACLPRPPTLSRFHRDWAEARERAWTEGLVVPDDLADAQYRPNTSRTPLRGLGLLAVLRSPRLWLAYGA